jgi:hypothetical protein
LGKNPRAVSETLRQNQPGEDEAVRDGTFSIERLHLCSDRDEMRSILAPDGARIGHPKVKLVDHGRRL